MPEADINFPGENEEKQKKQDPAKTGDQGWRRKTNKTPKA